MSDIESRLAELEARIAISDVVYKFCRAADRSDLGAIAAGVNLLLPVPISVLIVPVA